MTFVRSFSEIGIDDVPMVGGKNASLGEMYRELTPLGIPVPNGFAVTADGYRAVLLANDLLPTLHDLLDGIDAADVADLQARATRAREAILRATLPAALASEIRASYRALLEEYGPDTTVAVRSSATAEDLPNASFAGQHESFLNVRGEAMLLEAYRNCLASLFLERAIHYRIDRGFDHFAVALSVGVMKNVRSDLAASGVAFTLDTESGFRDVVFITGSYGLGENVVQGTVAPDEFFVHTPTYELGYRAILRRRLGSKERRLVFSDGDELRARTINRVTSSDERATFCVSDDEVLTLAGYALAVERHYSRDHKHRRTPMDIEWAKDGIDGRLYLVQARPETVVSQENRHRFDVYRMTARSEPIVSGRAVGTKIATGPVRIVRSVADLSKVAPKDVLVSQTTTPDWEPVMRTCAAIVTDRGGRTCHAAIVARELGIPAVVGTENATLRLRDGEIVTVSCAQGETAHVYEGALPFDVEHVDARTLPKPPVGIMTILADPERAFARSHLPVAGVGLVRIEFIVSAIGVHPMALAHPERLDDDTRAHIAHLAAPYTDTAAFFVERLSEGVGTIAAAFYPRPVIVRMSDFKTNEYAMLAGGQFFEPREENPMLGFRGAARYTHPAYADGFALECRAMRRVRETMGLTNVRLMIPFCRRVDEADRVIARMAELGLHRHDGLEIYVMCEIPNNALQADEFAARFDGFSIGSNDLTQLVLGVDRDCATVAFDFDERDPGVLRMLAMAIAGAKRNGKPIGICGQGPSDYPEFARWLIEAGIDSISLDPESVIPTLLALGTAPEVPVRFPTPSYA
ncbi:MAG TPA: phosphoenolpyruvate synthase [Candidatus Aquilonibacter sp.]|nr:phosphoenolpyruvate synthase [Candidatus Aquilonibacter sp.]